MASLNIPYTFTNGTIANATEVDAVMQAIKSFVETETVQKDGSVKATNTSLNDLSVSTEKIANGTILTTNFNTTTPVASGGVPVITVSTSAASGGKAGDVWIVV